jgi:hypothetical protein
MGQMLVALTRLILASRAVRGHPAGIRRTSLEPPVHGLMPRAKGRIRVAATGRTGWMGRRRRAWLVLVRPVTTRAGRVLAALIRPCLGARLALWSPVGMSLTGPERAAQGPGPRGLGALGLRVRSRPTGIGGSSLRAVPRQEKLSNARRLRLGLGRHRRKRQPGWGRARRRPAGLVRDRRNTDRTGSPARGWAPKRGQATPVLRRTAVDQLRSYRGAGQRAMRRPRVRRLGGPGQPGIRAG